MNQENQTRGEMPRVYAWEWTRTGFPKNGLSSMTREIVAAENPVAAMRLAKGAASLQLTTVGHEVALAACFPGIVFYRQAGFFSGENALWYRLESSVSAGKGRTIKEWLESLPAEKEQR